MLEPIKAAREFIGKHMPRDRWPFGPDGLWTEDAHALADVLANFIAERERFLMADLDSRIAAVEKACFESGHRSGYEEREVSAE